MNLSFYGAARTVTGSKHLLTLDNGKKILLDCGLFQGLGADTGSLNESFGFNAGEMNVLLLSPAHIDHSGLIPKLVKEGFKGKVICTEATKELAEILLHDSAEIQAYESECINRTGATGKIPSSQPLYTATDVAEALNQFETVAYNKWIILS